MAPKNRKAAAKGGLAAGRNEGKDESSVNQTNEQILSTLIEVLAELKAMKAASGGCTCSTVVAAELMSIKNTSKGIHSSILSEVLEELKAIKAAFGDCNCYILAVAELTTAIKNSCKEVHSTLNRLMSRMVELLGIVAYIPVYLSSIWLRIADLSTANGYRYQNAPEHQVQLFSSDVAQHSNLADEIDDVITAE